MRIWLGPVVVLCVAALGASACSSTAGSGSGGGTASGGSRGSGGTTAGGVSISVASATRLASIGSASPASGNQFVEINVTLRNISSSSPVSMNFALFTVATDKSLVFNASATSASVTPGCSPSGAVAQGGSFTCNVVFEIPSNQSATKLSYNDQQGHTASAPVPAVTTGQPPCGSNPSCPASAPYCSAQLTCVQCRTGSDCSVNAPCCSQGKCIQCVPCSTSGQCAPPTPLCSPQGQCVQCTTSAQCAAATPVCSPQGQCVQCLGPNDCGAGHTCKNGQCV